MLKGPTSRSKVGHQALLRMRDVHSPIGSVLLRHGVLPGTCWWRSCLLVYGSIGWYLSQVFSSGSSLCSGRWSNGLHDDCWNLFPCTSQVLFIRSPTVRERKLVTTSAKYGCQRPGPTGRVCSKSIGTTISYYHYGCRGRVCIIECSK